MGQDKYGNPNRSLLTRAALRTEVEASLQDLRTNHVEMYMFHRDDVRIDVSHLRLWANELVMRQGKARQWGLSNWSFDRFRQAFEFCLQNGLEPPRANSPQFSLAIPRSEVWPTTHSISGPAFVQEIEWYEKHHVELLCWEVLAKGFMAKPDLWNEASIEPAFLADTKVELGSDQWRLQRIQKAYCYNENYKRRRVAVQLARQYGCTLSRIATLYVLSRGQHISVIFGTNKLDQLQDMVGLQQLEQPHMQLDEEDLLRLDCLKVMSSKVAAASDEERSKRLRCRGACEKIARIRVEVQKET